jgi:hypothetical protein
MKKTINLFVQLLSILSFSGPVFSQSIYVNETDINKLDIKYCELRVGQPLNPTKVKIFVDYGQAFSVKRQNIMTPDKKLVKFNSPMHALNFMDQNGWSYVEQVAIQAGETTTYKYLMIKN